MAWVRTDSPGSTDKQVLQQAGRERRTLITFDKDFGELAFRAQPPISCGIILFRLRAQSPSHVAAIAVEVLRMDIKWEGHFAVVEDDRVRITPLPSEQ